MPPDAGQVPRLPFPVVGVGASAGGLEAYTELLNALPADTGMAFVLIQHLPPDRESLLVDLLSRQTRMPVFQVEDGQAVEPNTVYVIRPGHTLTIKDGKLRLGADLAARGHGRPVDDFFRSLAEEQQQRAIAVVLSGMGSNGSAGAQAVKAVGGLVVAQAPESAKYPHMPRSLIDHFLADFVLRPAEMPEVLRRYADHPYVAADRPVEEVARRDEQALGEILGVIRARTRHDFTGYRKPTLLRRVLRRMGLGHVPTMAEYARQLRQSPSEVATLADDLLIHVTGFFRDPEVWDALRAKVIDPLVAERPDGAPIRCWVTACATGEEAYTLTILLVEAAEKAGKQFDIKVFATDMAERALGGARAAVFPGGIESEVSPERLDRYFDKDDATYRVKRELRELVVFAPQNVLQDPPFSRLDIITCRNLLIYLEPEVQHKVIALLHFGLREGGALVLGTSESVGPGDDEFETIDKKHRLFRRLGPTRHGALDFPRPPSLVRPPLPPLAGKAGRSSIAQLASRALLEWFTPAAVVVDGLGQIVYFHGDTGRYLDHPRGEPTQDLLALANEQVRGAVRTALHRASDTQQPVTIRDGLIDTKDGRRRVEVGAAPIDRRPATPHYLITFRDYPEPPALPALPTGDPSAEPRLVDELARARDELQSALEEMQTSNEELKASHEEVTSINEELQSTNEELETSKEELQSLNEELTTVNAQYQAKLIELEATTNDLTSLLASTDIAVIFLDRRSCIRRYTPAATDLFELIPSDVGRPVDDLRRKFTDPDLLPDAQAVLDRLVPVEREVASESGRAYLRRASPYRTSDNRIEGVVVSFVDVTQQRADVAALAASEARYRALVESQVEMICHFRPEGTILYVNAAYARAFGTTPAKLIGTSFWDLIPPEHHAVVRAGLDGLTPEAPVAQIENMVVSARGPRWTVWTNRALAFDAAGRLVEAQSTGVDVTDRKQAEAALKASEGRLRTVASNLPHGAVFVVDADLRYVLAAGEALASAGYSSDRVEGKTVAEVLPPDLARMHAANFRRALAGEPFRAEDTAHGRQYITHGTPLRDAAGRVTAALAVSYDITDRKRAEAALQESEGRLRMALAAARMGIWTLDAGAGVQTRDANLNALLGLAAVDTAQPFAEFFAHIHPPDRPTVEAAFARCIRDHQPLNIEFRVARPDGAVRWLRDQGDVFHTVGSQLLAGACVDITDLKEAEADLRASEERLRLIVESATDYAIFTLAPDRVVTTWSPGAEAVFGYTAEEMIGRSADELFTPEDRAAGAPQQEADAARQTGRAADERWHLRKDGSRFFASGVLTPLGEGSRGFVKVLRDLTERKRMEEELERRVAERTSELAAAVDALETEIDRRRDLTRRRSTAQEDERRRVARDLHDTLGQMQAGLGLALAAARTTPGLPAAAGERLDEVKRMADELGRETHGLAVRLRPTSLDDLGLEPALRQLVADWFARTGVGVEFDATGVRDVRLPPDVETAVYRVVQEALTNVAKHAGATAVSVVVTRPDGHVAVVVEDDGAGFDPEVVPKGRLGLLGMRERVELVGGTIDVESAPGGGTTVAVQIPIPNPTEREPPAG